MKTIVLALSLMTFAARAADPLPADAPVNFVKVRRGESLPFDAVCEDGAAVVTTAKRIRAAEAERDDLRASHIGLPWLIIGGAALLLIGGGAAVGGYRLCQDRGGCGAK